MLIWFANSRPSEGNHRADKVSLAWQCYTVKAYLLRISTNKPEGASQKHREGQDMSSWEANKCSGSPSLPLLTALACTEFLLAKEACLGLVVWELVAAARSIKKAGLNSLEQVRRIPVYSLRSTINCTKSPGISDIWSLASSK